MNFALIYLNEKTYLAIALAALVVIFFLFLKKKTVSKRMAMLLISVAIILAVWTGNLVFANWFIDNGAAQGQFGDQFGACSALFSGLAFVALIYTIMLQSDELKLQREEIGLQREEVKRNTKQLEGQKLQLKAQNETMQKQNFDSAFFQLLRFHNDLLSSINLYSNEKVGMDCFESFLAIFKESYYHNLEGMNKDGREKINVTYIVFHKKYQSYLGHYFRNLYNIIKFIDKSSVEDKQRYANLVRAQLSCYEHALLFYNCLSNLGYDKFRPLIEKYALLKNMPNDILLDIKHKEYYEPSAFGTVKE